MNLILIYLCSPQNQFDNKSIPINIFNIIKKYSVTQLPKNTPGFIIKLTEHNVTYSIWVNHINLVEDILLSYKLSKR